MDKITRCFRCLVRACGTMKSVYVEQRGSLVRRMKPVVLAGLLLTLAVALHAQSNSLTAEPILTESLIFDDGIYGIHGQSPDSRLLAISYLPIGGNLIENEGNLWLLDVATASMEQVPLQEDIAGFNFVIWVDESTVITTWFYSPIRTEGTLGLIDLETGAMTPLTQVAEYEHGVLSRGPSEDEVLLGISEPDATGDVIAFNWNTRERRPFLTTDTREEFESVLSPTGRYLAFRGLVNQQPEGIYSLDLTTKEVAFIEDVYPSVFFLTWSPDDQWFLSKGGNDLPPFNLYLTENRAGGAQFIVMKDISVFSIEWAYSGEYIAYTEVVEPIPELPGYAHHLHIVPTAELGLTLPLDIEALERRFDRVR